MRVRGEIHGLDDIKRKMDQLAKANKIKNAATRSARKAMNLVKKDAVRRAKAFDNKNTGTKIWKNIVTAPAKTPKNKVLMQVGIKGGAKQKFIPTGTGSGGDTWYWRFLEFGTSRQPATPFMRPALTQQTNEVEREFTTQFSENLDKEIAKL